MPSRQRPGPPGQPVMSSSSRTWKTPPAIQAAPTTASRSARVRMCPLSVTVLPSGVHGDVAVVADQRVAVQRGLHQQGDVSRIGVVAELDVVPDVADAGQPSDRLFGRLTLPLVFHQPVRPVP